MNEKNPTVLDVLGEAFDKSNGETVDLIMEHGELAGLRPEMMDWWLINQSEDNRYHKWYPKDHISFKWEVKPGINGLEGALSLVEEKIGEFEASVLRIRPEGPPGWSTISDENDRRVCSFHEAMTETANGLKLRSTFRLPAKTPKKFLDAMYRHNMEEMALLPDFLPALYQSVKG
jgi:hypothetical protein